MRSAQITILNILLAAVSGFPAPKLEGEALEHALERLNAPEPWEKRDSLVQRQFMIDGYEETTPDTKDKRQFMIDGYEELEPETKD